MALLEQQPASPIATPAPVVPQRHDAGQSLTAARVVAPDIVYEAATHSASEPLHDTISDLPPPLVGELTLETDQFRGSLCQRAYVQIRKSLITSTIRPGHKLILRPLAAELGLSPTPVREALLRLVSEHALELDERGSAVVPVMTLSGFRELIEIRGDLEARAAERAVQHASMEQIDQLERINDRCVDFYERNDHADMLDANASFHRGICKAADAPLLLRMLEGLWTRIGPLYAMGFDKKLPPLGPAGHPHRGLIDALRRRDVEAARQAALVDVEYGNQILEATLLRS
ncbi:GntR family transcriptional regulator [Lichenicola sp.]|uniref:GntR family transcriptional regulator n=1 Tax=Lichenicola sp. TaxID=2804529 RepID=UPI003AFFDDD2